MINLVNLITEEIKTMFLRTLTNIPTKRTLIKDQTIDRVTITNKGKIERENLISKIRIIRIKEVDQEAITRTKKERKREKKINLHLNKEN